MGASKGCSVAQITIDEDATSEEGHAIAKNAVRQGDTLLWASIPCTGGSPWQHINVHKHCTGKLKEQLDLFFKVWSNFEELARECVAHGGVVAIEWP